MRGPHRDQNRVLKRWKIAPLAKFEFLLEVTGKIVVPRILNGWTERRVSLNKNFARCFTTSGPSGYLREQLKRPFAGAEVRQMQSKIGINDSDQRDVRKMQTLRDHLRPDEDVDLSGAKTEQRIAIRLFACHRIGVHSADGRFWEKLRDG